MADIKNKIAQNSCLKKVLILSVPLIILVTALGYIITMPNYLVLPILPPPPNPSQQTKEGNWNIEIFAKEEHKENGDLFYTWRVETLLIDDGQSQQSADAWDAISSYFHSELSKAGWSLYEQDYGNRCRTILPESKLLERDTRGYEVFIQNEKSTIRYSPIVSLAILPEYYSNGQTLGYYVILATQNPSRWTMLSYLFD